MFVPSGLGQILLLYNLLLQHTPDAEKLQSA